MTDIVYPLTVLRRYSNGWKHKPQCKKKNHLNPVFVWKCFNAFYYFLCITDTMIIFVCNIPKHV